MHPSEAEGFEWDDANQGELWGGGHRIRPHEVEDVFWNYPVWVPDEKDKSGDYKMIGRTDGGRKLTLVVEVKTITRQLRPITGWNSTRDELSRYGGGRGR